MFIKIVHFFICLKKRTKERGSRSLAASLLVRLCRTTLCCSQKADDSESRPPYGLLRRVVLQFFAVLLGCVKRQKQKHATSLFCLTTPL
jgi:hypothetical protein